MTASARLALVEARLWPVAASLSADDLEFVEQMLARLLVTGAPLAPATRARIQRYLVVLCPTRCRRVTPGKAL